MWTVGRNIVGDLETSVKLAFSESETVYYIQSRNIWIHFLKVANESLVKKLGSRNVGAYVALLINTTHWLIM